MAIVCLFRKTHSEFFSLDIEISSPTVAAKLLVNESTHSLLFSLIQIFGSDRSPRRGDVVRACVRVSLSPNNEF